MRSEGFENRALQVAWGVLTHQSTNVLIFCSAPLSNVMHAKPGQPRQLPFLEFSQKRRLRQVRSPPQPHRETRAAAGPIVDRDGTAVRFRDRFHKAETQPEPTP